MNIIVQNRFMNGFILIFGLAIWVTCTFDSNRDTIQNNLKDSIRQSPFKSLDNILVYNDSIGDVSTAIATVESRIDSLYDMILMDIKKLTIVEDSFYTISIDDYNYYLRNISNCKKTYKELIETNAAIYRVVYGIATGGGAASDLYYYYFLEKYYVDVKLLHNEINAYIENIGNE